jgi:transposase
MTTATPLMFGADVAKDEIWVACHPRNGAPVRLRNESGALGAWLATLPRGSRLAMESTGIYHRRLASLAQAAGMRVYVLNPRDVYHYARGVGARAKTDRVDAALIARYLAREHEHLHPFVPARASHERLATLLTQRAAVVRARMALAMSLRTLEGLGEAGTTAFAALDRLREALDAELERVVHTEAALAALYARLRRISGVGPLVAALLAMLLSRVPFACSDALVAYVGLDPRANQSGHHDGRRHLSKRGHPEWRRLLVVAAMSAARTRAWAGYVERQRAKGLPATAVHVILARKLLRVAYAIAKSGQDFDAQRLAVA